MTRLLMIAPAAQPLMPARRSSSSREGTLMLCCWFPPDLRRQRGRLGAARDRRPHGRTGPGGEERIAVSLADQQET